jgi:hypothetical protein
VGTAAIHRNFQPAVAANQGHRLAQRHCAIGRLEGQGVVSKGHSSPCGSRGHLEIGDEIAEVVDRLDVTDPSLSLALGGGQG